MKTQSSAGGIVVNRRGKLWHVLILKDMNSTWTFPKGLIEAGETPEVAAGREIEEEAGVSGLTLIRSLSPITYVYERNGLIKKTVQYFVFQSPGRTRPKPQKTEGISAARWVPIERAIAMIGYRKTNVNVLEEAWKSLPRQTSPT